MFEGPAPSWLVDRRHVSVILRLVLNERGRLLYGHVVDHSRELRNPFTEWRGMARAVRAWLATVEPTAATDRPRSRSGPKRPPASAEPPS